MNGTRTKGKKLFSSIPNTRRRVRARRGSQPLITRFDQDAPIPLISAPQQPLHLPVGQSTSEAPLSPHFSPDKQWRALQKWRCRLSLSRMIFSRSRPKMRSIGLMKQQTSRSTERLLGHRSACFSPPSTFVTILKNRDSPHYFKTCKISAVAIIKMVCRPPVASLDTADDVP